MPEHPKPNIRSSSTADYEWKRILRGRPRPQKGSDPGGVSPKPVKYRDARRPMWVEVLYSGGPEGWWVIRARNEEFRFPGTTTIHEALQKINGVSIYLSE